MFFNCGKLFNIWNSNSVLWKKVPVMNDSFVSCSEMTIQIFFLLITFKDQWDYLLNNVATQSIFVSLCACVNVWSKSSCWLRWNRSAKVAWMKILSMNLMMLAVQFDQWQDILCIIQSNCRCKWSIVFNFNRWFVII